MTLRIRIVLPDLPRYNDYNDHRILHPNRSPSTRSWAFWSCRSIRRRIAQPAPHCRCESNLHNSDPICRDRPVRKTTHIRLNTMHMMHMMHSKKCNIYIYNICSQFMSIYDNLCKYIYIYPYIRISKTHVHIT